MFTSQAMLILVMMVNALQDTISSNVN